MRPQLLFIVDSIGIATETQRSRDLRKCLRKTVKRRVEIDDLEDVCFLPAWLVDGRESVEEAHDVAHLQHERGCDAVQVGDGDFEEGFVPLLDRLGAAVEVSGAIDACFARRSRIATERYLVQRDFGYMRMELEGDCERCCQ